MPKMQKTYVLILLLIIWLYIQGILQFLANKHLNARKEVTRLSCKLRSSQNVTKSTPPTFEHLNVYSFSAKGSILNKDSADSIVTGWEDLHFVDQSVDPLNVERISFDVPSKPLAIAKPIVFLKPIPPIQEPTFEFEGTKELNTFIDKKIKKLLNKVLRTPTFAVYCNSIDIVKLLSQVQNRDSSLTFKAEENSNDVTTSEASVSCATDEWSNEQRLEISRAIPYFGKDFKSLAKLVNKSEEQVQTFFNANKRKYNFAGLLREYETNKHKLPIETPIASVVPVTRPR